ncbi:MAG TPA: serine/threonine-protein kinase [Ktedonobacterales bacterium]
MAGLEGTRLGPYEIIQRIGGGGVAEVYRAKQLSALGREAALKVIRPDYTGDPTFRARFLREATAISQLSHPNILPLLDFGEENGTLYLVMPLVHEGSLRDLLQRRGEALPGAEAMPLFAQLCNAVQYAHDQGIVHHDIKPQNILLQRGSHVLLSDFGIARDRFASHMTLAGAGPGAIEYMAPEQAVGQADARSDIYSLGVVLYQMLTGATPYSGSEPLHVLFNQTSEPMPDPRRYAPNLSTELVQALQIALAKEPQDRFVSAAAFRQAVQQASGIIKFPQAAGQAIWPGGPGAIPSASSETLATRPYQSGNAAPTGAPPAGPLVIPPVAERGWPGQPPQREAWHDAPTWAGQDDFWRHHEAGGGQPPGYDGPPPGGGGPPDDHDHRRGHGSLLVALIVALVLVIAVSSIAYGYFGLGWLRPSAGSSGGQPVTPSPTPTSQPTNTPTPTPTYPPPSPSPTTPEPSPSPSPSPGTPEPSPTTPSPGPSPSPPSSPESSPTPGPTTPSESPTPTTGS